MSVRFRMMELDGQDDDSPTGRKDLDQAKNVADWAQEELDRQLLAVESENKRLGGEGASYTVAPAELVMNQLSCIMNGSVLVVDTRPPDQYK